ncbi:MAG: hypothetical protein LQ348_003118 [Seirophora lacunosa]|nr:MAG: hypothetical protein LQ348_003118 [Seirophora lacunosa]
MADTELSKHVADPLEDTLSLVLKETGRFFRAARSQDARQLGIAKAAISHAIPAANLKFHDALDDIEVEIIRAKSVFERDLSSIRAKRAARERAAAGLLKPKSPNGVKKGTPTGSPKDKNPSANPSDGSDLKPRAGGVESTDVQMKDEPTTIGIEQSPPLKLETANDAVKTEPFTIPQSLSQDPSQPKGLAISLDQEPLAGANTATAPVKPDPEPKNNNNTNPPSSNDQNSQPPLSATFPDAQFESMFNETDLPTATDDLDFSLNFSTDDAHASGTDLLDASAFQNITMPNLTDHGQQQNATATTTANEDLTALLPGLENYVNGSGSNDFGPMAADFLSGGTAAPPTTTTTAGDADTTTATTAQQQQQQEQQQKQQQQQQQQQQNPD